MQASPLVFKPADAPWASVRKSADAASEASVQAEVAEGGKPKRVVTLIVIFVPFVEAEVEVREAEGTQLPQKGSSHLSVCTVLFGGGGRRSKVGSGM